MKKEITLFIFLTIFFYFSFSFVTWELNPQIWKIEERLGFISFMFINLIISMALIDLKNNNKK
jgi:hypothetical protein